MVKVLNELAPMEGFHTTILDGVKLRRSDRSEPRTPVMYEPSVYFVASGRKKGYVGDRWNAVMLISVCNWTTTERDVDEAVASVRDSLPETRVADALSRPCMSPDIFRKTRELLFAYRTPPVGRAGTSAKSARRLPVKEAHPCGFPAEQLSYERIDQQ
jgi:hypothetical protein